MKTVTEALTVDDNVEVFKELKAWLQQTDLLKHEFEAHESEKVTVSSSELALLACYRLLFRATAFSDKGISQRAAHKLWFLLESLRDKPEKYSDLVRTSVLLPRPMLELSKMLKINVSETLRRALVEEFQEKATEGSWFDVLTLLERDTGDLGENQFGDSSKLARLGRLNCAEGSERHSTKKRSPLNTNRTSKRGKQ